MIPTKEQLTLAPSEWSNFINHLDQPMGDEFWAWLNLWDRFTENNPMTCHEEAIVRYGHYRGFMDLFIVRPQEHAPAGSLAQEQSLQMLSLLRDAWLDGDMESIEGVLTGDVLTDLLDNAAESGQ